MVTIVWNNGQNRKELGTGKYTAQNGDFPNDVVEQVIIPFGWLAKVSRDFGEGGNQAMLEGSEMPGTPKTYNMADVGLEKALSFISVEDMTGGAADSIPGGNMPEEFGI